MSEHLAKIADRFQLPGRFVSAVRYGSGHINDTYLVELDDAGARKRCILQRVNHAVFRNVDGLMDNIVRVTEHIRHKLSQEQDPDISRHVYSVLPAKGGGWYARTDGDEYWRALTFIEGAHTYDVLETPEQAYQAAKAFGRFQSLLTDLPGERLCETIPSFHDGPTRLRQFHEAVQEDRCNRARFVRKEIEWVREHESILLSLASALRSGLIPERISHNDAKINNVMLDDASGAGVCVVDLDTVMPGTGLFDFGDLVRTCVVDTAEDEPNPALVTADPRRFEALVAGYLASAGAFLTEAEIRHMVVAGKMITMMIGLRFLTDFLRGDVYFRIHRDGHNLDRCRTQFALVDRLNEQHDVLEAIVRKHAALP
ncbi:MAG: aminoglycoside phosphotransferase family protein [Fimbriimonadales bacterium]|nr:aminoglycoside phosphotransferase family protein [Fimbriimonadales bacterium]